MESFVFAAGMDGPGIDQGRKQFIKVIAEIICQFKIIHIFFDLHFSSFNRAKRFITFMGCALFIVIIKTFINGKICTVFQFGFL